MILGACVVVVLVSMAAGGFFAFRGLRAEPAPRVPDPTRVVKVDVAPEG